MKKVLFLAMLAIAIPMLSHANPTPEQIKAAADAASSASFFSSFFSDLANASKEALAEAWRLFMLAKYGQGQI